MKTLIVIPTRNRPDEIINTINFLNLNKNFFSKIIIVDSSDIELKEKIKKLLLNYSLNIKLIDAQPSTCTQRNIGFSFIEDEEFIMFLDDDNIFYNDALLQMNNFLKKNINFAGIAFNQILKEEENFSEKLKKNFFTNKLSIYPSKKGGVSRSGWQSKFINFENDEIVEWLPTRAVIYRTDLIKNLKFDENLGIYGYLEDLDFSLELKKKGKLMVCSNAKYTHDQSIDRSGFEFGKKEVRNRYYLVQKHNLNKYLFFITLFAKMLINLKEGIFLNKNSLQRFYGNIIALMSLNKIEK
jgi:GT2 family glycosyltransferase